MSVAIIMGSGSDYQKITPAIEILHHFGIEPVVRVLSAHRSPDDTLEFAKGAKQAGIKVIIAAAGKSAHLPGVIAAVTDLPVIGLPIATSVMGGMDSMLSIVQMPSGVPVMTVALDGAVNAALSAIRILALSNQSLAEQQADYIEQLRRDVLAQDEAIQQKVNTNESR